MTDNSLKGSLLQEMMETNANNQAAEIEAMLDDVQAELHLLPPRSRKMAQKMIAAIDQALHVEKNIVKADAIATQLMDYVRDNSEM